VCLNALAAVAGGGSRECDAVLAAGGLRLVEQAREKHDADEAVQSAAKRVLSVLTQRAAALALREINMCAFCARSDIDLAAAAQLGRLTARHASRKQPAPELSAGRAADFATLVTTVVAHMAAHAGDVSVIAPGLDALLEIVRDAKRQDALVQVLCDSNVPSLTISSMDAAPKDAGLVWKGCLLITMLARRPDLAAELGKFGAPRALKQAYDDFGDDREVRQQAVWAMASMCSARDNFERFKRAQCFLVVVDVLAKLRDTAASFDGKVALPLVLREVWTDKELDVLATAALAPPPAKKKAAKYMPHYAKAKRSRNSKVEDDFGKGAPGLLD